MLGRLYARLCHAFLVALCFIVYMILCNNSVVKQVIKGASMDIRIKFCYRQRHVALQGPL